ncbi:MAG: hypothetical protein ACLR17_03830 [Enterobacteriaceae bacterium]
MASGATCWTACLSARRGGGDAQQHGGSGGGVCLTLLTVPTLGNHALWLALAVFLALRGLSLAVIWRRHWRRGTWFS